MMKNRKAQGFTLIELLIVIAIIGILAAVLIPNLLGARTAANAKAAQTQSTNAYKALYGYMVADSSRTAAAALSALGTSCTTASTAIVDGFGWKAAPAGVTSCTASAVGTDDFSVAAEGGGKSFINGVQQ